MGLFYITELCKMLEARPINKPTKLQIVVRELYVYIPIKT